MRKLFALAALALIGACTSSAQTTYTLNLPFSCDAASVYPVTSITEFSCRVNNPIPYPITLPNFLDANGNKIEFYFWASLDRIYAIPPQFSVTNAMFQLTEFTVAKDSNGKPITCGCGVPCEPPFGTVAFTWSGTDTSTTPPTPHNGTVSWQWANLKVAGGRGCQWYHPLLQPGSTVTVDE